MDQRTRVEPRSSGSTVGQAGRLGFSAIKKSSQEYVGWVRFINDNDHSSLSVLPIQPSFPGHATSSQELAQ